MRGGGRGFSLLRAITKGRKRGRAAAFRFASGGRKGGAANGVIVPNNNAGSPGLLGIGSTRYVKGELGKIWAGSGGANAPSRNHHDPPIPINKGATTTQTTL